MNRGQIAADIHRRMVDDNRFGYSWGERWGANPEKWTMDGLTFTMNVGDFDCSSSCITAWKKALTGSKYANAIDGATYTGNMRSVFVGSGLFEWKPMSFLAQPGDLYLNEANHVAMCQTQTPDILSEFCISETGGTTGKRGDQTGREAYAHGYYDYPWDGILHYNGKADGDAPTPPKPTKSVKFRVKQGGKWLLENMTGERGKPIQAIAISMPGWYQVATKSHGWLERVSGYDIRDEEYGYAGLNDSPIVAVRCYYETHNPSETGYFYAKYRVSEVDRDWFDWQIDDEVDANQDGYAGDYRPIDRFEIQVV